MIRFQGQLVLIVFHGIAQFIHYGTIHISERKGDRNHGDDRQAICRFSPSGNSDAPEGTDRSNAMAFLVSCRSASVPIPYTPFDFQPAYTSICSITKALAADKELPLVNCQEFRVKTIRKVEVGMEAGFKLEPHRYYRESVDELGYPMKH